MIQNEISQVVDPCGLSSQSQLLWIALTDGSVIEIEASKDEIILDVKQTLCELLPTCFYTNYKLSHKGKNLCELTDIRCILSDAPSEAAGTTTPPQLLIVPERYGDRSLRLHLRKTKELTLRDDTLLLASTMIKPPITSRSKDSSIVSHIPSNEHCCAIEKTPSMKKRTKKKSKKRADSEVTTKPNKVVVQQQGNNENADPEAFAGLLVGMPPSFELDLDIFDTMIKCGSLKGRHSILEVTKLKHVTKAPKCVESIESSIWNPPIQPWRIRGDLWYLEIVTLERKRLAVIGQEEGFLIAAEEDCKTHENLDIKDWWKPQHRPDKVEYGMNIFWTLHQLLSYASPLYTEKIKQRVVSDVVDPNFTYRIFATPQVPVYDWVSHYQSVEPIRDVCRLEESLERATGCDVWDVAREWNEELQYSRELPKTSKNLFTNQTLLKQRNQISRRQQILELRGASMNSIKSVAELKQTEDFEQKPTNFYAEDAAIIKDRNLAKLISQLTIASAQGAMNIREGKIAPLGNTEDQIISYLEENTDTHENEEVKVYAWNNLFLVQASEVSDAAFDEAAATKGEANEASLEAQFCSRRGMISDIRATEIMTRLDTIAPVAFGCYPLSTTTTAEYAHATTLAALEKRSESESPRTIETAASTPIQSTTPTTTTQEIAPKTLASVSTQQSSSTPSPDSMITPSMKDSFMVKEYNHSTLIFESEEFSEKEPLLSIDDSRISNLYTLASSLVDYAGERTLCQTIIPGLLSGELNSRPVFGATSLGEPYTCESIAASLLDKHIKKTFGLKTRSFNDCSNKKVECCVPLECKVLQGADHRRYFSDMGRILPIDFNWLTADERKIILNRHCRSAVENETFLRQQIARKNSCMLIRPEALAAYLYQAAIKRRKGKSIVPDGAQVVEDWDAFVFERGETIKLSYEQREKMAKASWEWTKSMGLQLFPEIYAHIIPISASSTTKSTRHPMYEWPGIEILYASQRFQWSSIPPNLKKIAAYISQKVNIFQWTPSDKDDKSDFNEKADLNDENHVFETNLLQRPLDRWNQMFLDSCQDLFDLMPVKLQSLTSLQTELISLAKKQSNLVEAEKDSLMSDQMKKASTKEVLELIQTYMARDICSDWAVVSDCCPSKNPQKSETLSDEVTENHFSAVMTRLDAAAQSLPDSLKNEEEWTDQNPFFKNDVPLLPSQRRCQIPDDTLKINDDDFSKGSRSSTAAAVLTKKEAATPFMDCIEIPELFNPNLTNLCVSLNEEKSTLDIDFQQLQNLSSYVMDVSIERLVDHLIGNRDEIPLESDSLARLFHSYGVNIRYLGHVIHTIKNRLKKDDTTIVKSNRSPPFLLIEVLERELLSRLIKNTISMLLVKFPMGVLSQLTVYCLNIVFSEDDVVITQPDALKLCGGSTIPTPEEFWKQISRRSLHHFKYKDLVLPSPLLGLLHHRFPLLRMLCKKIGLQLMESAIDKIFRPVIDQSDLTAFSVMSTALMSRNGGKLKYNNFKKSFKGSSDNKTFHELTVDDIYGFVPVIKTTQWNPETSKFFLNCGVTAHQLDLFEVAFECYQQCVQLQHQINFPISRETLMSQCGTAAVSMSLGDIVSSYLCYQKVVLLIERLEGPDHPDLIQIYLLMIKLSLNIILSPNSIVSSSSTSDTTSSFPMNQQLLIQIHHINLCKTLLGKAMTLAKLWTGSSSKSPYMASLLIQSSKISIAIMSFLGSLRSLSDTINLKNFKDTTQQAISSALSQLPLSSTSGPTLSDADCTLALLNLASEFSMEMRSKETATLYTIAQLEGELTAQYLATGEGRKALTAARRHRDVLIELLGPDHVDVQSLNNQISTMTRQAVIRAKQERSLLKSVDLLPYLGV